MEKYLIVKKYIDEMDYRSLLSGGAPGNEFDSESREISNRITCSQTEREIAQIIAEVFNRTFGDSNEVERFMACAKNLYQHLQRDLGR